MSDMNEVIAEPVMISQGLLRTILNRAYRKGYQDCGRELIKKRSYEEYQKAEEKCYYGAMEELEAWFMSQMTPNSITPNDYQKE